METISTKTFNRGLMRLHYFFLGLYCLAILAIFWRSRRLLNDHEEVFFTLGISVMITVMVTMLHYWAAKGARAGKSFGRDCTRLIAFFWLFAFPIGTALAIYAFYKTSNRQWQRGTEDSST
jgi:hypothetical protein